MAEIAQIILRVGDKEIPLTLAEAYELLDVLKANLKPEPPEPTVIRERIIERPYWERPYRDWFWKGPIWSSSTRFNVDGTQTMTLSSSRMSGG